MCLRKTWIQVFTVCTKYRRNASCIDMVMFHHKWALLCCVMSTLCIYYDEWLDIVAWLSLFIFIYLNIYAQF